MYIKKSTDDIIMFYDVSPLKKYLINKSLPVYD